MLQHDDEGDDESRTLWNGMRDKHPALIAHWTAAADVETAERARCIDTGERNSTFLFAKHCGKRSVRPVETTLLDAGVAAPGQRRTWRDPAGGNTPTRAVRIEKLTPDSKPTSKSNERDTSDGE